MKEWLGAGLGRQAAEAFLAEGFAPDTPRIEMLGNRRVLIENHKGILEYGDTLMRINCGRMIVRITGTELALKALSLSELAVTGCIASLAYDT